MARLLLLFGLLGMSLPLPVTSASSHTYCPVFYYTEPPQDCRSVPASFLNFKPENHGEFPDPDRDVLDHAFNALAVLQRDYFDSDYGTWPEAIDWTSAVTGTVLAGMLTTLSKSFDTVAASDDAYGWIDRENLISSYYAQVVNSYFGQNILSLRGQAYDDILWVVLGWIEAINFVSAHSSRHYPGKSKQDLHTAKGVKHALESVPWHGHNWLSSFAHRARVFWNLATSGWDTRLCHGGMNWNPRLEPYKNAITNELWISASVAMYRFFPGDNFTSPWVMGKEFPDRDPAHLAAAIEGYKWLKDINMTNTQGLYVDGYHISNKPGNVECDKRQEMVYTYNQGVILTGQRGLWAVTGSASYLEEGHSLIQSVINATGWSLERNAPVDDLDYVIPGWLPRWHGLGRSGILEEQCDASGTCSQDGQTFKAIFFHHLVEFCSTLDPISLQPGLTIDAKAYQSVKNSHLHACRSYLGWVKHNSQAALQTRNAQGKFGMWWGAGVFNNVSVTIDGDGIDHGAENTTDYRNKGTPMDGTWGRNDKWFPGSEEPGRVRYEYIMQPPEAEKVLQETRGQSRRVGSAGANTASEIHNGLIDPNDRGRGRRVETQIGGIALMRAHWELSNLGDE